MIGSFPFSTFQEMNEISNIFKEQYKTHFPDFTTKLPFKQTRAVFVTEKREFVIVENDNHSIHTLNEEGRVLNSFGRFGTTPTCLNYPSDVTVTKHYDVIVADTCNDAVKAFTWHGDYIIQWTIHRPTAVAMISDDMLVVGSETHLYLFHIDWRCRSNSLVQKVPFSVIKMVVDSNSQNVYVLGRDAEGSRSERRRRVQLARSSHEVSIRVLRLFQGERGYSFRSDQRVNMPRSVLGPDMPQLMEFEEEGGTSYIPTTPCICVTNDKLIMARDGEVTMSPITGSDVNGRPENIELDDEEGNRNASDNQVPGYLKPPIQALATMLDGRMVVVKNDRLIVTWKADSL